MDDSIIISSPSFVDDDDDNLLYDHNIQNMVTYVSLSIAIIHINPPIYIFVQLHIDQILFY
jgi:hypothetical protein